MSALNVFVLGDEAHIVTDGAASTFGVLVQFTNKTLALPHLRLAIGLRGNMGMMNRLRHEVGRYGTQEEALAGLPARLRKSFGLGAKFLPKVYGFDIGAIGWRDGKPFARLLSSVERPGQPAFAWVDIPGLWASPQIGGDELAAFGAVLPHSLEAAAVALVDAQRRANVVAVGGFVQITSYHPAAGISTRMLKAYPDRFVQKIEMGPAKLSAFWKG